MRIELTDTSVIKLRPCTVVKESADRYAVVRRAGVKRVVLKASGLEACNRFREGCAVREAKFHLAQRFQVPVNTVDISPLLRSLRNADLIASVDGERLREIEPPSLYSAYRHYLKYQLKGKLLPVAYRKLPVAWGKQIASVVHRLDLRVKLRAQALRAEEHFARSARICGLPFKPGAFARRYFHNQIQNIVDFQSLEARTALQAEEWAEARVEYEGLEHVAVLKSQGTPVILAGFHFSAVTLLAMLLMRRGHDVAQVWLPHGSANMESINAWAADLNRIKPNSGKFCNVPDFSLPSYRRLLEYLRNGRIVIWLPDMFSHSDPSAADPEETEWRNSVRRVFGIGHVRTELAKSKLEVELFGQRVYMNPWIGTFAGIGGAAVVPASLIRLRSRMKLILGSPLRIPARASAREVSSLNRELFAQLDQVLRQYPDQWIGWHTLCPVDQTKFEVSPQAPDEILVGMSSGPIGKEVNTNEGAD